MNKFFITGADGWLGRNLVVNLINGSYSQPVLPKNIYAFCLPNDEVKFLKNLEVNICLGDITDIASIKKFLSKAEGATIIHLCGIIHPKLKTSDFFDINYLGAKHILQISKQVSAQKIVLMSSNSPIGCNKSNNDNDIFNEFSAYNPYMNYGKSKYLMEKFANDFIAHHNTPKITIVRAPWFYGPHQPIRQTLFFKLIKEGKFPIIGSGKNKRSMAYTDNLSQGIILSASKEISNGKIYWLADKNPYTINEIVRTIKNVLTTEFDIQCKNTNMKAPSIISDMANIADSILQSVGLYHQKIHVLSELNKNIFCSIQKAEDELGYKPKFELYSGMRESIKWCLENNIPI